MCGADRPGEIGGGQRSAAGNCNRGQPWYWTCHRRGAVEAWYGIYLDMRSCTPMDHRAPCDGPVKKRARVGGTLGEYKSWCLCVCVCVCVCVPPVTCPRALT
jgi:hypothetical protein